MGKDPIMTSSLCLALFFKEDSSIYSVMSTRLLPPPLPDCYLSALSLHFSSQHPLFFVLFSLTSPVWHEIVFLSPERNKGGENWNVREEKRGHWQFASRRTKRKRKWGKKKRLAEQEMKGVGTGEVGRDDQYVLQKADFFHSDSIKENTGKWFSFSQPKIKVQSVAFMP